MSEYVNPYTENEDGIEALAGIADNAALQTIFHRCTLRKYDPDRPITAEEEQAILHAAVRAPSASNMMRWSVIVLRSEEKRRKMAEMTGQTFIAKAPLHLVFCADFQRQEDCFRHFHVPEKCEELGKKFWMRDPCGLMLSVMDCSFAAQQAVLAGEALGIGSCCIGHVLDDVDEQREFLGLPMGVAPVVLLAMGHIPDGFTRLRRKHLDQKYVVSYEQYHSLTEEECEQAYTEWNCPPNDIGAENKGQHFFLRRYGKEDNDYVRSANSVYGEIFNNWCDPEGYGPILNNKH